MLQWFCANSGTIAVSLVLIALVAAIVHKLRRDRKKGRSCCGGSCGGCALSDSCHKRS